MASHTSVERDGRYLEAFEPIITVGQTEIDAAVQALGRGDIKAISDFIGFLQLRMDVALGLDNKESHAGE